MPFSARHAALWINTSSKSPAGARRNARKNTCVLSTIDCCARSNQRLATRQLVIVPHRALHYLPFQALHDGESYLIERREVSFAPSAVVLQQCLDRPKHHFRNALLLGVADEQIPGVHEELRALDHVFTDVKRFSDEAATTEVLRQNCNQC